MAITTTIPTLFGEDRECYIRLNNVEASNHGVESYALFRAFLSEDAFKAGSHYVAEFSVPFTPDVTAPLWGQAYAAFVEKHGISDAAEV